MIGMQDESEFEYAEMKDFLSFYAERYLKAEGLPPDKEPMACLAALEKKSMKMASKGLRQAINVAWKGRFILTTRRSRA
jgi:hypothetical protein